MELWYGHMWVLASGVYLGVRGYKSHKISYVWFDFFLYFFDRSDIQIYVILYEVQWLMMLVV